MCKLSLEVSRSLKTVNIRINTKVSKSSQSKLYSNVSHLKTMTNRLHSTCKDKNWSLSSKIKWWTISMKKGFMIRSPADMRRSITIWFWSVICYPQAQGVTIWVGIRAQLNHLNNQKLNSHRLEVKLYFQWQTYQKRTKVWFRPKRIYKFQTSLTKTNSKLLIRSR